MTSAIILLSGGLDSLVALDIISKKYNKILALFFNYGQKALLEEREAVEKISKIYSLSLEEVELPFLKKITNNALTNENNTKYNELQSVWIPNRNNLFLNIGASYCDAHNYNAIIFGANKEESIKFSDNKKDFIDASNECFKFSTRVQPKIIAPCADMSKVDLINYIIDNNINLNLIKSCYQNINTTGKKHCNNCLSCKYLYGAILKSKKPELIKEIF